MAKKLSPEQLASLRAAEVRFNLAREYLNGLMIGLGLDPGKSWNVSDAGEISELPVGPQFG